MSSASSSGRVRLDVYDELRVIARTHPDFRVTASGVASRTGHDVELVRPVMIQAADDGLLKRHLVAKCTEDGSESDIDAEDVEDLREGYVCDSCGVVTEHIPYVVFSITPELVAAADLAEAKRTIPKRMRHSRVPLLAHLGKSLIRISRGRAIG